MKRDVFGGGVQNGLDLHLGDFGVGNGLGRTFAIADLEEVQRGNAIDLFDRELGILHIFAFVLEFFASGFELFINAVEFRIFMIAQRFDREAVADIVILFMCCRAISLHLIRTAFGAMPSGHTRLCARLCARPLRGLRAYAERTSIIFYPISFNNLSICFL